MIINIVVVFVALIVIIGVGKNKKLSKKAKEICTILGSIVAVVGFVLNGSIEKVSKGDQPIIEQNENTVNSVKVDNINGNNNTINQYNEVKDDNKLSDEEEKEMFPQNPQFKEIKSEEFNYKVVYPSQFQENKDSTPEDLYYHSLDNKSNLQVTARKYDKDKELAYEFTIDSVTDNFDNILTNTDKTKEEGWYAIGYKTNKSFVYIKCMMDGKNIRKFKFTYPTSQHKMYHDDYDYVAYIEREFVKLV